MVIKVWGSFSQSVLMYVTNSPVVTLARDDGESAIAFLYTCELQTVLMSMPMAKAIMAECAQMRPCPMNVEDTNPTTYRIPFW